MIESSVDTSVVQDIKIVTKKLAEMISTSSKQEESFLKADITTKSLNLE